MKKLKLNTPFIIGLLLFSVTQILIRVTNISESVHHVLLFLSLPFGFWGVLLIVTSPEMKNSKIRQWKLRLIGRGEK